MGIHKWESGFSGKRYCSNSLSIARQIKMWDMKKLATREKCKKEEERKEKEEKKKLKNRKR